MKKVGSLLVSCLLLVAFGLGSDAIAKDKKIEVDNTEWLIQGTAKMYDSSTGDYLGSMAGGTGLAVFYEPETGAEATVAPMVISGPMAISGYDVVAGATAHYSLDSYTVKGNKINVKTNGTVTITPPGGGPAIEEYSGEIIAKYKFTKKGTLTAVIKYTNNGILTTVEATGQMLGKLPD
jgi:hypothetical protein